MLHQAAATAIEGFMRTFVDNWLDHIGKGKELEECRNVPHSSFSALQT